MVGLATVFGTGGATSSYREIADADVIVLWGSNARETHPILFHHILRAVRRGARLFVVDPRRTATAAWAELWLGLDVGSDIALANAVAREIIASGMQRDAFIERATTGFAEYAASVAPFTLEEGERLTGVPADAIRTLAHAYAGAERAQLCWTLGVTEHHDGVDGVLALIDLALLTGHVGRYGSGLNPLRGQNNVQGGGDMGAIPNKLPGFQDIERMPEARSRFERAWDCIIPERYGWHITAMFDAMERGDLRGLYVLGEDPVNSEADTTRTMRLLEGLDQLIVQDLFLTSTAELADVVLPAAASWAECEGSVTSSERRVQRVRAALPPPGDARDDLWIIAQLARRLGREWGEVTALSVWDEVRALSPMHAGMSYARLEAAGGLQWPCVDEHDPGSLFLHARLWEDDETKRGPRAPFSVVHASAPIDELTPDYPLRLTTGRTLDSFNTGVQTAAYTSPLRRGGRIDLAPEDADRHQIAEGERVRVTSRRGSLVAPAHVDPGLRPGLAFLAIHFPDEVATNVLTADATDPKSGTAEFKATAIRVEKLSGLRA